uniref:hypothetical protein n=1 Tax=Streptomyces nigra TaxID=1827580 RepID=UPI0036D3B0B4
MAKFALRAKSVGDWASSIVYLTGFASRNAALRGVTIHIDIADDRIATAAGHRRRHALPLVTWLARARLHARLSCEPT